MRNEYSGAPENRPLNAWAYWAWKVVYTIPVIGFIFLIVNTFRSDNINRRSFTRSYWCSVLVGILLFVGLFVAILVQGGVEAVKDSLSESIATAVSDSGIQELLTSEVTPDFKAQMDACEAVAKDYATWTHSAEAASASQQEKDAQEQKLADMLTEFNAIDKDALSSADGLYYTSTMLRIAQNIADSEKLD